VSLLQGAYLGTFQKLERQLRFEWKSVLDSSRLSAAHARLFPLPRDTRAPRTARQFEQVEQVVFQNQEKWEQTGDVDGTVASFSPRR